MSITGLIYKEIRHRKINFVLGLLAVVTAVALFISFFTAGKGANRETARLMLKMGYNMHIISKDTNINEFLLTGIADKTIPESYLYLLGSQKKISYNHLMATLQKQISWKGTEVILTGLSDEVWPEGKTKPPILDFKIKPGELYVGYRVAQTLGLKEGDRVEIEGKEFTVVDCLEEAGGADDIRVQMALDDAQEVLKMPEQISEIRAVDCLCFMPSGDPVAILRAEIGSLLPEAQVFQIQAIADARAETRKMVKRLFGIIMPFVVIACGVWISVLATMNVRERQQEIGIMRALGYGSSKISVLFLGKAVLTGLLGALVGFGAGTALAIHFGPKIFELTGKALMKPEFPLLGLSLIFAPLFAAISTFIPAMIAVAYDPAITLREE